MAFKADEEVLYNAKKKKFFVITNVEDVSKALAQNPSKLGFTKMDIVNILHKQLGGDFEIAIMMGVNEFSKNNQKDVDSLLKDMIKRSYVYEDLIIDVFLREYIFYIKTSLVGGKKTLSLKSRANHPISKWREIVINFFKNMGLTSEDIKKIHLTGLYRSELTTVLDGEMEIMYFIEKTAVKKKSQILNEVGSASDKTFDVPYRWNYAGTGTVPGGDRNYEKKLQYNFSLPKGGNVVVSFEHHFGDKITEVEFSRRSNELNASHSMEVTGEGDAIRILSTVLAIIKEFCSEYKPKKITFTAAITDKNESRSRVYEKMLQRHASSMKYKYIANKKHADEVKFIMEKM